MTNEEIRIKIAQAKGFDKVRQYKDYNRWTGEHIDPEYGLTRDNIPNWPENIADAWELVEEMPFYQIYKSQLVTGQTYYGCMCFMRLPCDEDNPDYIGEAGAVPRAISLAWLAWDAARKAGE